MTKTVTYWVEYDPDETGQCQHCKSFSDEAEAKIFAMKQGVADIYKTTVQHREGGYGCAQKARTGGTIW